MPAHSALEGMETRVAHAHQRDIFFFLLRFYHFGVTMQVEGRTKDSIIDSVEMLKDFFSRITNEAS